MKEGSRKRKRGRNSQRVHKIKEIRKREPRMSKGKTRSPQNVWF